MPKKANSFVSVIKRRIVLDLRNVNLSVLLACTAAIFACGMVITSQSIGDLWCYFESPVGVFITVIERIAVYFLIGVAFGILIGISGRSCARTAYRAAMAVACVYLIELVWFSLAYSFDLHVFILFSAVVSLTLTTFSAFTLFHRAFSAFAVLFVYDIFLLLRLLFCLMCG